MDSFLRAKHDNYKHRYQEFMNNRPTILVARVFGQKHDIWFWSRQSIEHLYLLHLGLERKKLKKASKKLHNDWLKYFDNIFHVLGEPSGTEAFLTLEQEKKIGDVHLSKVQDLIERTIGFNNELLDIMGKGHWIGWCYPALIDHMNLEMSYFSRKVNGPPLTVDEEIKFANHHQSDEMAVTAQLVDPNEKQQPVIDVIRSYVLKKMSEIKAGHALTGTLAAHLPFPTQWSASDEAVLSGLHSDDQLYYLAISIRFAKELSDFVQDTDKKIAEKKLKTIIPPFLGQHVYREFVRSVAQLELLKS